jgi:inner membrane transporter RhtA
MARLSRATYALMIALLPATATVIGIVVLAQVPSALEAAGVALVVGGVALRREPAAAVEGSPPWQAPTSRKTTPKASASQSTS